MTCPGCGGKPSTEPQPEWSYSINTLVQTAAGQGVLGVLHALATLADQYRHFFAFAPSMELFREGSAQPWHEVDIVCIADGELIIGEVKEAFLQEKDFRDIVEVGKALKVQRVALFLPIRRSRKQTAELDKWMADARAELSAHRVKVDLYELPEF